MPTITARDFSSILNLNPFESPYECLKSKIIKKTFTEINLQNMEINMKVMLLKCMKNILVIWLKLSK